MKGAFEKGYKKATPAQIAALTLDEADLEPAAGYDPVPPRPAREFATALSIQGFLRAISLLFSRDQISFDR